MPAVQSLEALDIMNEVAHSIHESIAEFRQKHAELYDIGLRVSWIVREAHRMDAELTPKESGGLKRKRADEGEETEIEDRKRADINVGDEMESRHSKKRRTHANDELDEIPQAKAPPRSREQTQDTGPPRRSSRISAQKHRAQAQRAIGTTAPSEPHDRPTTPLQTQCDNRRMLVKQHDARVAKSAVPGRRKRQAANNV
jgi:hypothetical protein